MSSQCKSCGSKSKPLSRAIIKSCKTVSEARFDYKMSTSILYARIKYSMCDLICDVICGVGRSAGSTHFPYPSLLPLPPFPHLSPFPSYRPTAGDLEIMNSKGPKKSLEEFHRVRCVRKRSSRYILHRRCEMRGGTYTS